MNGWPLWIWVWLQKTVQGPDRLLTAPLHTLVNLAVEREGCSRQSQIIC